jgi:hypothetical protein
MCDANSISEKLLKMFSPTRWFTEGYHLVRSGVIQEVFEKLLPVSGSASRADASSHRTLTVYVVDYSCKVPSQTGRPR